MDLFRTLSTSALTVALIVCAPRVLAQDASVPDAGTPAAEPDAGTPAAEQDAGEVGAPPDGEAGDESGAPPARTGTGIEGVVTDRATGETLIEAAIRALGGSRTFTDYDGAFSLDLAPGRHTLRVAYDGYQTTRVDVVVRRGERTHVEVALTPDTEALQEVVVTARADRTTEATQLQMRQQSASVSDAVSAQEIARSPDATASDAARRVVGAAIVGGQYLFVRGLGGRFTNVLLDGVPLPSVDPDAPGVQLDLFPASLLTSLTIYKTFTPDLPADMVGGAMDISTREFPSHFHFGLNLTLGLNSATTFAPTPGYRGGGLDWLGFDDGTRGLPSAVSRTTRLDDRALPLETYLPQARAFENVWAVSRTPGLPNLRVSADVGDTLTIGGHELGYTMAITWGATTQRLVESVRTLRQISEDQPLAAGSDLLRESGKRSVLWGAIASASYQLAENDRLSLTGLYTEAADDYAGYATGHSEEDDQIASRRLTYVQRGVGMVQLSGDHRGLPLHIRLRWHVSGSAGLRAEPDTRDVKYREGADGNYQYFSTTGSGTRLFSELTQLDLHAGADLSFPIETATLRLGWVGREGERAFSMRRFEYTPLGSISDIAAAGPEQLFAPDLIGTRAVDGARFALVEQTRSNDGYHARQSMYASFAMLDWPVLDWLRIVGGVRVESFRQVVANASPFARVMTAPMETARTNVDVLPSAEVVFRLMDGMFVRASYGATVARPLVRELAPYQYPDYIRLRNVTGNPNLNRTRVDGFDLRWEWFPGATEVLAVSGFYKSFSDPIESVVHGFNNDYTYQNVQGARLFGAELEARLSLGRITDALRFFDFGGNLALVDSLVELSPEQRDVATNATHPLLGQSPYVANLSLGFSHPATGLTLRLYYNVFGPRLTDVGTIPIPDVYQQPFQSLDFTAVWKPDAHFTVKGTVTNILNQSYVLEQGGIAILSYRPGLTIGLGLSWEP